MIWFVDCQAEHLDEIQGVDMETRRFLEKDENARALLPSIARTMVVDDEIAACFGCQPIWFGVVHAWTALSPLALDHGLTLTRAIRRYLSEIEERDSLHRIQASVLDGFSMGHRWARVLGFHPECKMARYSPKGEDAWLYARVRN